MSATTLASLQAYKQHPNVRKYLNFLAAAEGTSDYDTGFGGKRIANLAQHPGTVSDFTDLKGRKLKTTAAGRYQIIKPTWDSTAKEIGVRDFGPNSQDLVAIRLLQKCGALDDIVRGDFNAATAKANKTWASLPGSKYDQRTVSRDFMHNFLNGDGRMPSKYDLQRPQTINPIEYSQDPQLREALTGGAPLPRAQAPTVPQVADMTTGLEYNNEGPEGFAPLFSEPVVDNTPIGESPAVATNDYGEMPENVPQISPSAQLAQSMNGTPMFSNNEVAALAERADNIRNNAVTQFLSQGEQSAAPIMEFPEPLRNEINNIMTNIGNA